MTYRNKLENSDLWGGTLETPKERAAREEREATAADVSRSRKLAMWLAVWDDNPRAALHELEADYDVRFPEEAPDGERVRELAVTDREYFAERVKALEGDDV